MTRPAAPQPPPRCGTSGLPCRPHLRTRTRCAASGVPTHMRPPASPPPRTRSAPTHPPPRPTAQGAMRRQRPTACSFHPTPPISWQSLRIPCDRTRRPRRQLTAHRRPWPAPASPPQALPNRAPQAAAAGPRPRCAASVRARVGRHTNRPRGSHLRGHRPPVAVAGRTDGRRRRGHRRCPHPPFRPSPAASLAPRLALPACNPASTLLETANGRWCARASRSSTLSKLSAGIPRCADAIRSRCRNRACGASSRRARLSRHRTRCPPRR
mmetsp:Transcript_21698/g.65860  ORF Transcript_21698/g.65860 Transcript_21698/m.65860 type:complete len:268 (+) Transcript_21698:1017-1820(+)